MNICIGINFQGLLVIGAILDLVLYLFKVRNFIWTQNLLRLLIDQNDDSTNNDNMSDDQGTSFFGKNKTNTAQMFGGDKM